MSEDVVLTRLCRVRRKDMDGDGELRIQFFRPTTSNEGKIEAVADATCEFFTLRIVAGGVDEVQAFMCLFDPVLASIDRRCEELDLVAWWLKEGDLAIKNFWKYQL